MNSGTDEKNQIRNLKKENQVPKDFKIKYLKAGHTLADCTVKRHR